MPRIVTLVPTAPCLTDNLPMCAIDAGGVTGGVVIGGVVTGGVVTGGSSWERRLR